MSWSDSADVSVVTWPSSEPRSFQDLLEKNDVLTHEDQEDTNSKFSGLQEQIDQVRADMQRQVDQLREELTSA